MTERVLKVEDLALRASNDLNGIHRTVAVFDVSEPGPRAVCSGTTGTFVASYYISTLTKREMDAERDEDLVLHGGRHKITVEQWRENVYPWLREMSK